MSENVLTCRMPSPTHAGSLLSLAESLRDVALVEAVTGRGAFDPR
jgi:hypothetical protein